MANGTITREEYREKIFPNITNLGAMGGGITKSTILCLISL